MGKILVIDDDELVRSLIQKILEKAGHTVAIATDGNEGIAQYQKVNPDLIITDLIMPDKEGLETIIELRQNNPEVKIIAISGGGRSDPEDYLNLAKGLGAQQVLSKPFERDDLLKAVNEVLKKN